MSAFGLNRYAQRFAVAVNKAGTRIADKPITCVDRLVSELFEYGTATPLEDRWTFIYPFVGGTAVSHSFNLINPDIGKITWQGTVTHNVNGITGDGSTGKGNTGMRLASTAVNDVLVSCGVYSRTATAATQQDIGLILESTGAPVGATDVGIIIRWTDGNMYAYNTGGFGAAVPNSQGLFSNLRGTTSAHYSYRNGVYLGTVGAIYNGPPSADSVFYILDGGHGTAAPSGRNIAFAFLSTTYTTFSNVGNQPPLYNIIQAFQTRLGRQV